VWLLPAADAAAAAGERRRYGPDRNEAVEATLVAAAEVAAAGGAAAVAGATAPPPAAAAAAAGPPPPKRLAAAVAALLASPAGLDPLLPATIRAVTLTAPAAAAPTAATSARATGGGDTATSTDDAAQAAATAAARAALESGWTPPRGTYELRIEYTCLSVEVYPTAVAVSTSSGRIGSKVWVGGAVLPLGAAVAGGEVGANVLLVVDERGDGSAAGPTPLLACGTAAVGGAAVRVSTDLNVLPTAASWAVGDRCGRVLADDAIPDGVRLDCLGSVRGGRRVESVAVAAAVTAAPSTTTRPVDLFAAAVGVVGPTAVPAPAQRLRLWGVGNGTSGGAALRSAATTATARTAVTASAVDALPRLDTPVQLGVFVLLPAVAAGALAALHTASVAVSGGGSLLPVGACTAAAVVRWGTFAVEVTAAAAAVGGAVTLLEGIGGAAARGYVAVEEGGVLLQTAAAPGLPVGHVLVVTAVPVVEGVLVRVGSRQGERLVWAAAILGCLDLVWDVVFVAASAAVGWWARRTAAAEAELESSGSATTDDGALWVGGGGGAPPDDAEAAAPTAPSTDGSVAAAAEAGEGPPPPPLGRARPRWHGWRGAAAGAATLMTATDKEAAPAGRAPGGGG